MVQFIMFMVVFIKASIFQNVIWEKWQKQLVPQLLLQITEELRKISSRARLMIAWQVKLCSSVNELYKAKESREGYLYF